MRMLGKRIKSPEVFSEMCKKSCIDDNDADEDASSV